MEKFCVCNHANHNSSISESSYSNGELNFRNKCKINIDFRIDDSQKDNLNENNCNRSHNTCNSDVLEQCRLSCLRNYLGPSFIGGSTSKMEGDTGTSAMSARQTWYTAPEDTKSTTSSDSFVKNEEVCNLMENLSATREISLNGYLTSTTTTSDTSPTTDDKSTNLLSIKYYSPTSMAVGYQSSKWSAKSILSTMKICRSNRNVNRSNSVQRKSRRHRNKLRFLSVSCCRKTSSDSDSIDELRHNKPQTIVYSLSNDDRQSRPTAGSCGDGPNQYLESISLSQRGDSGLINLDKYSSNKGSLLRDHKPCMNPTVQEVRSESTAIQDSPCTKYIDTSFMDYRLAIAYNPFRSISHQFLLTLVPLHSFQTINKPHFDWVRKSSGPNILVKAVLCSSNTESSFINLSKYVLEEKKKISVDLPPSTQAAKLIPEQSVQKKIEARLLCLHCTNDCIIAVLRTKNNTIIWVYDLDLEFLNTEWLMKNSELLSVNPGRTEEVLINERVSCFVVDKLDNLFLYYHRSEWSRRNTNNVEKENDYLLHKIYIMNLPDLNVQKKVTLNQKVFSIKTGAKYFAVCFENHTIGIFSKTSKQQILEISSQKKLTMFSDSDCFEMDNRDRFIYVAGKVIKAFFHNGVLYKEFNCPNLDIFRSCHMVGKRRDFFEGLFDDVCRLKLDAKLRGQSVKLSLNNKIMRIGEEFLINNKDQPLLLLCDNSYSIDVLHHHHHVFHMHSPSTSATPRSHRVQRKSSQNHHTCF